MTTTLDTFPRAFAVNFRNLYRWDPSSFHKILWHWSSKVMQPLGSTLRMRREKIDRTKVNFSDLQPITIHFDGSIDRRKVDGNREYTMDLFRAKPGDIVVAKIDLKNGAVGIVPKSWDNIVVTSHFAVYEPDRSKLVPEYLHLLIQAKIFKDHLWRNKVGAEGRKEVKLDFFEAEVIPLPPIPVQKKIVAVSEIARKEAMETAAKIDQLSREIEAHFLAAVGVRVEPPVLGRRSLIMAWSDVERWDLFYHRPDFLALKRSLNAVSSIPLGKALKFVSRGWCKSDFSEGIFRYVEISNVTKEDGISGFRVVSVDKPPSRATTLIHKGDLILSMTRPYLGAFAFVPAEYDHCVCSSGFSLCAGPAMPDLILEYALEFLKSSAGLKQMERRMTGGLYPAITQDQIEQVLLPVPSLRIQHMILEYVSKRREEIARLKAESKTRAEAAKAEVEAMILGTKKVVMP